MPSRSTMPRRDLEEFERFLLSCGYEPAKPRGEYEMVRMYQPDGNGVLLVHRKSKPYEPYTIFDQSEKMYREWLSFKSSRLQLE